MPIQNNPYAPKRSSEHVLSQRALEQIKDHARATVTKIWYALERNSFVRPYNARSPIGEPFNMRGVPLPRRTIGGGAVNVGKVANDILQIVGAHTAIDNLRCPNLPIMDITRLLPEGIADEDRLKVEQAYKEWVASETPEFSPALVAALRDALTGLCECQCDCLPRKRVRLNGEAGA